MKGSTLMLRAAAALLAWAASPAAGRQIKKMVDSMEVPLMPNLLAQKLRIPSAIEPPRDPLLAGGQQQQRRYEGARSFPGRRQQQQGGAGEPPEGEVAHQISRCGAMQVAPVLEPKAGELYFKAVQGIYTVPNVTLRTTQTLQDQPQIAIWVGIDGMYCNQSELGQALVRAGSVVQLLADGTSVHAAFSQVGPVEETVLMDVDANPGEQIGINITMESPMTGHVVTHQREGVRLDLSMPICGLSVAWQVEDFAAGLYGPGVLFSGFSTFPFSLVQSQTYHNSTNLRLSGSRYNDMLVNNHTYCQPRNGGNQTLVMSSSL